MDIPKIETLLKHSTQDLIEFISSTAQTQQSSAVCCAKGIIALIACEGSEAKARATMKAAKVSDCTVKNAMQLVWAYDAVVRPGHATEAWFDQLLYVHAVEVRRAIAKVTVKKLHEWGMFNAPAKKNLIEFELIADTGLNRAEREVAATAKAESEIAAAVVAKAAPAPEAVATTEAVVETTKPAKAVKAKKSAIEEFDALMSTAEKFISAVVASADDLTIETMKNRIAALAVVMDQKTKERGAALRKAA